MRVINWCRQLCAEGVLYFSNYVVTHIPVHFLRKFFYRHVMNFVIGKDSYIFMGASFDTRNNFEIGHNSVINQNCRLDNRGGLFIGNNVSISSDVCILTADHNPQSDQFEGRSKPIKICDYVFVGTRAMILPGVTLGKGCLVCAGAVVTKDVDENVMVAGVPARPINKRNEIMNYTVNYGRLFH
ncbi:MAG: acyltransferase [Glaciimonas sp.]|nr:acyltransferase [Glaciimonas sp.]